MSIESAPSIIVVTMFIATCDAVCAVACGAIRAGVANLPHVWRQTDSNQRCSRPFPSYVCQARSSPETVRCVSCRRPPRLAGAG